MIAAPDVSQASANHGAQCASAPVDPAQHAAAQVVDVVFPLLGQAVARDHAQPLHQAVLALWPWLEHEPAAAVHPLKLVPGNEALGLLSQRTRLVLRVPACRLAELTAAAGLWLQVRGQQLQLGAPQLRALRPYSAMYAYRVAADSPDEAAFMAQVGRELDRLGIVAARVCDKHQRLQLQHGQLDVFGLLLHEMTLPHALRLQQQGLGGHRLLGCGVFVPHKSAAAV